VGHSYFSVQGIAQWKWWVKKSWLQGRFFLDFWKQANYN